MNQQEKDIHPQEKEFHKALKAFGHLFPTTEDEVEAFEQSFDNELKTPTTSKPKALDILKRGYMKYALPMNLQLNKNVEENLARAAREGREISEDIKEQMKKDRDDTRKKK
jgi:hypothetical protein